MRRYATIFFAFPILAAVLAYGAPAIAGADVGVHFNINVGPPPIFVAPPSDLVLIPGTGVYFIPDVATDVFFYGGSWWAPRGPEWYRARSPRGPWTFTRVRAVPRPLFTVPRDYRGVYAHERHIPYGQWKKGHGDHWREGRHGHRDR